MRRVALLVDVQNLYYTARQAFACHVNYPKLWQAMVGEDDVAMARAYAIDRGDERQRRFQGILRDIGFEVCLKPYIQRRDGSSKGDWDVGIALDAVEVAPDVDRIVLASGDGDFALLAQRLRERHGCRVEVFGVRMLTAEALIQAANHFTAIEGDLLLRPAGGAGEPH
ncbi:NYN domain-containing protein [Kushneria phosphatilytica]|uniref:NYN domain-containing protein n=1 Tax=Kushneria phosphatilytica TaxID=657387 RepID=A0A1S1NSD5_9GAMM|nr:NYN domain-containing protein [Kushneria phosphatilytica]OHV12174.1 nuclease [Kushneria phosphatilytica]QEL11368.1 NYN domain-containing protein [Kushneria phosphatilytica]